MENTGGSPLPFCAGAHTAFRCPLFEGERFEDYQLVFSQAEDASSLLLTPEGLIRCGALEPVLSHGVLSLDYGTFQRMDTVISSSFNPPASPCCTRRPAGAYRWISPNSP